MPAFLTSLFALPFVILAVLFLLIILTVAIHVLRDWIFRKRFRAKWWPQGKFVLFVYSNSPTWQRYIEERILPEIKEFSVVLNWSERQKLKIESPLEFRAFRFWTGEHDFNPAAVIVPPLGGVKIVRFWKAFRDYKHGKPRSLNDAERQLQELVQQYRPV